MVAVPAEFTLLHENPVVPSAGDNVALLDWAQACASNARLYELQIKALKDLR